MRTRTGTEDAFPLVRDSGIPQEYVVNGELRLYDGDRSPESLDIRASNLEWNSYAMIQRNHGLRGHTSSAPSATGTVQISAEFHDRLLTFLYTVRALAGTDDT